MPIFFWNIFLRQQLQSDLVATNRLKKSKLHNDGFYKTNNDHQQKIMIV